MNTIFYTSQSIVKQLLEDTKKNGFDRIEISKNTKVSLSLQAKIKNYILNFFEFEGDAGAEIQKNINSTKIMTTIDHGRDLLGEIQKINIINHLDKDFLSPLFSGLYTFSTRCHLNERIKQNGGSEVVVSFTVGTYRVCGFTSTESWGSGSILNNLLFTEYVNLEGLMYVLGMKEQNEFIDVFVQYILIGRLNFNEK